MHPALRSVKGAIIVDVPLKTDNEAFRQTACQLVAQKQAEITAASEDGLPHQCYSALGPEHVVMPEVEPPIAAVEFNRLRSH